jgi:hypothetical protein
MITKKHHIGKSYASIIVIIMLQCVPFLPLISYADEPNTTITSIESGENSTTLPIEEPRLEELGVTGTPVDEKLPPLVSSTTEIVEINVPTSTALVDTVQAQSESTQFESTGTSTARETLLFSDASTTESLIATDGTSTVVSDTTEDIGELPAGTTTITTGISVATANILNIVNTNVINSTGTIVLQNLPNGNIGDLDLRETSIASTTECTLLACNNIDSIIATISSDAIIDNNISIAAMSGSNTIDTSSSAVITTGDVYAGLNLINIANTTLIDSDYLLLSLNSFNDFNGDIVFPGISTFFPPLHDAGLSLEEVNTQSYTSLANNIIVDAGTGENTIENSAGLIQTGASDSSLNVYNNTNSTALGGNSLLLLLRVTGTWFGNLLGIPDTGELSTDRSTYTLQVEENVPNDNTNTGTINSTSTTLLTNTVSVLANSGKNVTTNTDNSEITTGDAYAVANIINITNTHIIGRNWILALINIFGNFNGNITFGKPDLQVKEYVSTESTVINGTNLLYKITITNNGDSISSHVLVTSSYDSEHLDILESSDIYSDNHGGILSFDIGDLPANASHQITFQARVKDTEPGLAITSTTKAFGNEKDNNPNNNTDVAVITTTGAQITIQGTRGYSYTPEISTITTPTEERVPESSPEVLHSLEVTRISTSTTITEEKADLVKQIIYIKNQTHTAIPSVIFNDYLIDTHGRVIKVEPWDLGTILPDEEITLTYTLSLKDMLNEGTYNLSSEIKKSGNQSIFFNNTGTVVYLKNRKNVILSPTTTPDILSVFDLKKSDLVKEKNTLKKISTVGNTLIETVFAEESDGSHFSSSLQRLPSSVQYIFLFLAFSIVRILRRNVKSV